MHRCSYSLKRQLFNLQSSNGFPLFSTSFQINSGNQKIPKNCSILETFIPYGHTLAQDTAILDIKVFSLIILPC